jgi:hypothetical protein
MLRLVECGVMQANCDDTTSRAAAIPGGSRPLILRQLSRPDEPGPTTKLQGIVTAESSIPIGRYPFGALSIHVQDVFDATCLQ